MARIFGRGRADPTAASRRRRLAIIGVLVFVLVDILLVAWALIGVRAPHEDSGAAATVQHTQTPSSAPTAVPSASATPTATPATAPAADAVASTRVLSVVDQQTAWRATTGACPATPATVELSSDGGAHWKSSDASGTAKASSVVRLNAQSAKQASAVALSAQGCTPEYMRTYVAGDNWATYPAELQATWYADPSKPSTVHSPTGDQVAPCPAVVGLAVRDAGDAAVLCSTHDVYRTNDGGVNWGQPLHVAGAVAIGPTDSGYITAVVGAPGCAGTASAAFDPATGAASTGGCAGTTPPAPGSVAIAGGGGSVWLWAGDVLVRSTDGGTTWR